MKQLAIIFYLFFISFTYAQNNTLKFTENSVSPEAKLSDVSWIAGHWKGEAFGGITEEIWSPPLGDSMMFSFKLVVDQKVVFYEIVKSAKFEGAKKITGVYIPTERNEIVRDHYLKLGFEALNNDTLGATTWSKSLDNIEIPDLPIDLL